MTPEERKKVEGHARDHVAYGWSRCLPVRHDRREWTTEEKELYDRTYERLKDEYRKAVAK